MSARLSVLSGSADEDPRRFDHFAKKYERRDTVTGGFYTEWIEGVLQGRTGERAIDLGCGTGAIAAQLTRHYRHVRAVDLSHQMVDVARSRHGDLGIVFEQGDIRDVTGSYDLVISLMVLHHLPDLPSALGQISRLVAPGGTAILLDPIGPAPTSRLGIYRFAATEFVRDVRRAWRRLRVNVETDWVNHLLTDEWLSSDSFAAAYSEAFPGAVIDTRGMANTMVWERPDLANPASAAAVATPATAAAGSEGA